jgi:hypothetical protein
MTRKATDKEAEYERQTRRAAVVAATCLAYWYFVFYRDANHPAIYAAKGSKSECERHARYACDVEEKLKSGT